MSDTTQPAQDHRALENVENPQALDVVISTTTSRLWIALVTIVALIGGVFVWSIVVTVPLEVTATGVLFDQSGRTAVVAPADGVVSFSVSQSAEVSSGEAMAAIGPIASIGDSGSASVAANTDTASGSVRVIAPVDGRVETISVLEGSAVSVGEQLAVIDAARASTQVVTFVSAATASLFAVGDTVELTEAVVDRSSARYYRGVVVSASSVPVTYETILLAFQSEAVTQEIVDATAGGAYQIVISLQADAAGSLPPQGQVLEITYRYAEVRPIRLLFGGDIE